MDQKTENRFKLGLVILSIALPLLAAEIYVRLKSPYGYWTPTIERARTFPYTGSVFCRYVFEEKERVVREGDVEYPINALGYRGRTFQVEKPSNTVRVLVYGGSTVLDLAASGDTDWPHQIEQVLRERGIENVEVINAGISGYTTFDCLGRLYSEGHRLSPDYVVLYDTWNDLKYFRFKEPILRIFKPYRPDPRLVYHGWADRLMCHVSQLYVRLRNRFLSRQFRMGAEGIIPTGEMPAKIQQPALDQYRLNLKLFVDCARNIGAVPLLMTEARLTTPDLPDSARKKIPYEYTMFDHKGLLNAYEEADRIIKEVGREKKVDVIDASAVLSGDERLLYDHVHTTAKGSKKLAELVAGYLEKSLSAQ